MLKYENVKLKQKRGPGWLILVGMGECLFPLRSLSNCRPHGGAPRSSIWMTNVFHFSIVHRFWSVVEFWDLLKPVDNDFHPQGHHRGTPPYWPLHCCPGLTPMVLLQGSDWFNIVPKNPSRVNVSFFPVALFLLAALFWLKSGLIKDNPVLSCGQIILTPI